MTEYREYIEKAEKNVSKYFGHCPLCYAEGSMEFEWRFSRDAMACSNCGAEWHINHGLTGFHWAKLIKANAEGRGTELVGKENAPGFWWQMALDGLRSIEETPKRLVNEEEATGVEATSGPWWWNPLKYFFHGISFSILLLLLTFAWIFIAAILMVTGYLIGLIIGFVILLFLIGGLNSFLTDLIWDIPIETDWKSLLGHGFVLFIALLIADIPAIIIGSIAPSLATQIVLFIVYAFIGGFIGRNVAGHWEEEYEEG